MLSHHYNPGSSDNTAKFHTSALVPLDQTRPPAAGGYRARPEARRFARLDLTRAQVSFHTCSKEEDYAGKTNSRLSEMDGVILVCIYLTVILVYNNLIFWIFRQCSNPN